MQKLKIKFPTVALDADSDDDGVGDGEVKDRKGSNIPDIIVIKV